MLKAVFEFRHKNSFCASRFIPVNILLVVLDVYNSPKYQAEFNSKKFTLHIFVL